MEDPKAILMEELFQVTRVWWRGSQGGPGQLRLELTWPVAASGIPWLCHRSHLQRYKGVPLRSYLALSGLWIRNLGERKLLKAAVSGARMSSRTGRGVVSPVSPRSPSLGRETALPRYPRTSRSQSCPKSLQARSPYPCQGLPLPFLISKKQVWKVLGS